MVYLIIAEIKPRLAAVREYLPEEHSETPDIRLRRKCPVHERLGGQPSYW